MAAIITPGAARARGRRPFKFLGYIIVITSRRLGAVVVEGERFERAFQVSPDPMTLSTLKDGRLREVNDAFLRAFGITREAVIGRTVAELGIWANPERDRALLVEAVRQHGVVRDLELPFRTFFGEERIFRVGAAVIDDPAEPHLLMVGVDLTERRAMESALKQSEARYRQFIEDLPLGVVITQNGVIKFSNAALQALIGHPPEALHGKPFLPFVYADDRPWLLELHHRRMRGETVADTYECRLVAGSGEVRYWRLATRTVEWDGVASIGVVTDITELRSAEEELRLAASVFNHAHEGIIVTDPDARIIAVNDAFTRLIGYSREEALGNTPRLFSSDRQEPGFYAAMWRSLLEHGEWQGELWNRRKDGSLIAEHLNISRVADDKGQTSHYVGLFFDVTAMKQHQQQLEHMAHYDALTGLPNRVLLTDRLQLALAQAQRSQQLLAVCYLDLDGFKPINDAHGHEVGDQVLIEVSHRLRSSLRGGDTVARLGGDEFVLLLAGLSAAEECEEMLNRILAAIALPYSVAGQPLLGVTASIGVAIYPIDHGDVDTLLRNADQSMYAAKRMGRNRFHLFDAEHDRRARHHRELLDGLRLALDNDQFRLHYQPKVNLRTGAIIGFEALLRWQHPQRGLLLPEQFLAVAEENPPLIAGIGNWVIAEVLRQWEVWAALGLRRPISVNIAASHLQQPDFVDTLAQRLRGRGMDGRSAAGRLELEIIESAALQDVADANEVIQRCRALGVSFALDDFGTGYSSLTYLRRLQVETLKIDQSFVSAMLSDAEDLAIVEGVIALTRAFRRQVIAEGVETPEHGARLMQLGCDVAQGHAIARPMPPAEVPAWTDGWQPHPLWQPGGGTAAWPG